MSGKVATVNKSLTALRTPKHNVPTKAQLKLVEDKDLLAEIARRFTLSPGAKASKIVPKTKR